MGIVAALDKVQYYNENSKYCVLQVKTANEMIPSDAKKPFRYSDHLIRFTAVGYDLPRTTAIQMELEGVWKEGKYGCQLQVERWSEIIPPTLEGIRGYLASGLLKGIGEKTADAIVQRFGVDALDVLEHHPRKLLEIRGITEEKLEEIKAGYAESKMMRDLMTLLAPFKVTPATALKIYEYFGPDGVKLLRQSPYRLCQVPGFGFLRVDAIVQKSGGDLHDPMRIQGALFFALEKARSEKGHLYLGIEELIKSALALLNEKIPQPQMHLSRSQVEDALERMILDNIVVSNSNCIYLPHVYAQEIETACKAAQMSLEVPDLIDLEPIMEKVKRQLGITLSRRQSEGVAMVFQHNLTIITGGPGTGKSTVLKAVIEAYRLAYPKNIIKLAAPTGKASRRMAETTGVTEAQTLHSLLGLFGGDASWQKSRTKLDADLVIVDETSMMDMWLAWQLFQRLRPGTKLLLVGDADQLESVGAGDVFHQLINSGIIPVTVLDEIFRQAKDSPIPYNAKYITAGKTDLHYSKEYFDFIRADTQDEAAAMIRSLYKKEAAATGVDQVQILTPFRGRGEASSNSLNEAIREEINPPQPDHPEITFGGQMFRLYDKVMQTKNNYELGLYDKNGNLITMGIFNGETGRICKIASGTVTVDFDGRFANYPLETLHELELAYASTVHKAQGSECDTIIMPLLVAHSILLTRNLLNTAITRAKRRVLLVGQKKALYIAIHTNRMGKRKTLLAERMRQLYQGMTEKQPPDAAAMKSDVKRAS